MFQTQFCNKRKIKKGISVVEIVVIIAILTIGMASLLGLAAFSLKTAGLVKRTIQATSLAQESLEQARNFRDSTAWSTNGLGILNTGLDYYFQENLGQWQATLGTEANDIFQRSIILENVSRNASDNIEEIYNPLNQDLKTKKVRAIVSWTERGGSKQIEIFTYLTNWK